MFIWKYLLVLFLAYSTGALEPPCCGPGGYLIQVQEQNDTRLSCNSSSNHTALSFSCPKDRFPVPLDLDGMKTSFKKDNTLILDFFGKDMIVENGSYCFSELFDPTNDSYVPYVILCGADEQPNAYTEAVSICMLVSVCFYLLTAVIYIFLPQLRDLLGLCIINFCVAIAIGLLIFAIMNLVPYTEWDVVHGHCAARGFFAYFFLVAGFFWSNVISIQTLRSLNKLDSPNKDWKTFYWYTAYAWGVPVILTSLMAIINFYPADHTKPGIGLNTCWFIDSAQRWYYLYSVMTILILVNVGIFIYISIVLWRSAHFKSDHARDIRYKFSLTWKLCILMGLPWIFEMIGSSFNSGQTIWFILDIINVLQGVLIFVVLVVLRKRAVRAMHARGWFLCLNDAVAQYLHKAGDDEAQVVAQTDLQDMTTIDK